jgi:hypothetical protein
VFHYAQTKASVCSSSLPRQQHKPRKARTAIACTCCSLRVYKAEREVDPRTRRLVNEIAEIFPSLNMTFLRGQNDFHPLIEYPNREAVDSMQSVDRSGRDSLE